MKHNNEVVINVYEPSDKSVNSVNDILNEEIYEEEEEIDNVWIKFFSKWINYILYENRKMDISLRMARINKKQVIILNF